MSLPRVRGRGAARESARTRDVLLRRREGRAAAERGRARRSATREFFGSRGASVAEASAQCGGVWGDTYGEKRQRSRSTASLIKRVSNDLDGEETYFDRNDGEAVVLGT